MTVVPVSESQVQPGWPWYDHSVTCVLLWLPGAVALVSSVSIPQVALTIYLLE